MPFLLHPPTIDVAVPEIVASNRVGDDPQSRSVPAVPGTTQRSSRAIVAPSSRTIAKESPASPFPIVPHTLVPSEAGLVQTLPPIDPLGTDQYVCSSAPEAR